MAPYEPQCAQHPLGVAVSGGSDSLALLYLLHDWASMRGIAIKAATVDHALRPEARAEAEHVAKLCETHGIAHDILTWDPSNHTGNLSMAAREGRYDLLARWIGEHGVLCVGHTQDDQAETFLMRLRRGSGVDGLAAMRVASKHREVQLLRPMLGMRRVDLRTYLTECGVKWCEDPTNENDDYERVRVRKAMGVLQELGLEVDRLAETAAHMARAKEALNARALEIAQTISREELNSVVFAFDALCATDSETRLRLLASAIQWVTNSVYRPRFASLSETWEDLKDFKTVTLGGCLLTASKRSGVRVLREANAQPAEMRFMTNMMWDTGWVLSGSQEKDWTVRPLGQDGLRQISSHVDANLPKRLCYTQPAIFDGNKVIACPSLLEHPEFRAEFSPNRSFLSRFAH